MCIRDRLCTHLFQLGLERLHIGGVAHLAAERGVDQNGVVIVQRLKSKREDDLVFIVPDIGFKEVGAAVVGLSRYGKDLL